MLGWNFNYNYHVCIGEMEAGMRVWHFGNFCVRTKYMIPQKFVDLIEHLSRSKSTPAQSEILKNSFLGWFGFWYKLSRLNSPYELKKRTQFSISKPLADKRVWNYACQYIGYISCNILICVMNILISVILRMLDTQYQLVAQTLPVLPSWNVENSILVAPSYIRNK